MNMAPNDFSNGQVWSILPDVLEGLIQRYRSAEDIKGLSAGAAVFRTASSDPEKKLYTIQDGVAVISVNGPIMKSETFWSYLFGGSSVQSLMRTFTVALEDREVKAIVLSIDSPGGTVSSLETLADFIYGSPKPVVSFGSGMMTSAAYWIGSSARSVIVEKTAQVGSIGVLMVHYDYSEQDRMEGLKRTFLSAGKYKTLGNDAEPLSSDARSVFEAQLDYYYTLFVDAVARNRKTDPEKVVERMAEGRLFIGAQALDAGLADLTGTLRTAVDRALSLTGRESDQNIVNLQGGNFPGKELVMSDKQEQATSIVTVGQLAAAYPALAEALRKEGAGSIDQAKIRTEASNSEKERILGLVGIQFGEEAEKKLRAIADQGITPEAFKAVRDAMGESENASGVKDKEKILAALKGSGAENPGAGNHAGTQGDKDFMVLVDEYAQARKVSKTVAMQAVMRMYPEAHKNYIRKLNA